MEKNKIKDKGYGDLGLGQIGQAGPLKPILCRRPGGNRAPIGGPRLPARPCFPLQIDSDTRAPQLLSSACALLAGECNSPTCRTARSVADAACAGLLSLTRGPAQSAHLPPMRARLRGARSTGANCGGTLRALGTDLSSLGYKAVDLGPNFFNLS